MTWRSNRVHVLSEVVAALVLAPALAQEAPRDDASNAPRGRHEASNTSPARSFSDRPSFSFAQDAATTQAAPAHEPRARPAPPEQESPFGYREISDFFNIREAYSNVTQGEWEFETTFEWETTSGSSDDYGPVFSLKYGITDTFFAEIEVERLELGEGGDQGNGELAVILFNQWWNEAEILPAFATWAEARIPSGEGSSGVDGELHINLTKELLPNFRGHLEGFIETANGARGGEDEELRRDFQWGVGPGFDYSFSDDTIAAVNYLMRSSEEYGHHNQNVLQLGLAQRVAQHQHVKFAVDVGLDGADETPNLGAKVLWSIEW